MIRDAGNCSSNMPWVEFRPSTQLFGVEEISYILPGCVLHINKASNNIESFRLYWQVLQSYGPV